MSRAARAFLLADGTPVYHVQRWGGGRVFRHFIYTFEAACAREQKTCAGPDADFCKHHVDVREYGASDDMHERTTHLAALEKAWSVFA